MGFTVDIERTQVLGWFKYATSADLIAMDADPIDMTCASAGRLMRAFLKQLIEETAQCRALAPERRNDIIAELVLDYEAPLEALISRGEQRMDQGDVDLVDSVAGAGLSVRDEMDGAPIGSV